MYIRYWEAFTVFLASSVKFLPSPFLSVNFYDFTFWQTIFISSSGGIVGILFFYLSSGYLMKRAWRRRMQREAEGFGSPKRYFTRTNKIIVNVKKRFGLAGLAFITPAIISIPIGSILAAKYFRKRTATLPSLLVSVLLWSFFLTGIASLFGSPFQHH